VFSVRKKTCCTYDAFVSFYHPQEKYTGSGTYAFFDIDAFQTMYPVKPWIVGFVVMKSKVHGMLLAFFMTFAFDTTMTFVMTTINTGWDEGFILRFVSGWIIGFIVAVPTSILAIPIAERRELGGRDGKRPDETTPVKTT
jgi:hypothetical protein